MSPDRQALPASPRSSVLLSRRWSLNASVRKAALEEDHAAALEAFRGRIAAQGLQLPRALLVHGDLDATLIRFLRARKWSVDAAAAMLEKSIAWRSKVQADVILEQELPPRLISLVRQCRPSSYIGFDDQHHPIFLERLGRLDGKRFEAEGVADGDVLAYHLREMEFMAQVVFTEASAAAGHTVDRVISIMDADGLTLSLLTGFAQRLFRLITAMDSDNYPETCEAIYIINAGAAFSAIWRLVSPFVDKGTRDKVHVLGSGRAAQAHLVKELGRERLPTFLGGDLDYEAVKASWYAKMDAVMSEAAAHPRGHQPPVVLHSPASANGHHHAHHHQPPRGSFSGLVSHLSHLGIRTTGSGAGGGRIDRHSLDSRRSAGSLTDTDGFATPMSAASRFSGISVYFDACEAEQQLPPGPSAVEVPSAPSSSGGGAAPGGGGTPGSMSVGPHSCTRSQLSGFTVAAHPAGAAGGAAGGGHAALGAAEDLDDEGPPDGAAQQPGCRCVIS